jgi:hypothetical protein
VEIQTLKIHNVLPAEYMLFLSTTKKGVIVLNRLLLLQFVVLAIKFSYLLYEKPCMLNTFKPIYELCMHAKIQKHKAFTQQGLSYLYRTRSFYRVIQYLETFQQTVILQYPNGNQKQHNAQQIGTSKDIQNL